MNEPSRIPTDKTAEATTPDRLFAFAFFHLNLAFSAIPEEARADVIARCYRPLLAMARRVGSIGIEATGYTLEEIANRDPAWIDALKDLIAAGRVEFIGSGYSQMIGPLAPAAVNAANLRIGNAVYRRLLGFVPDVALVNEQAYSGGLVELYREAGYRALLMDWNNPSAYHHWPNETRFAPQEALGADGQSIGLIWTDTVAFQTLQRYAHGDADLPAYLEFVRRLRGPRNRLICLYASDAEIFDYRPGRYRTEETFSPTAGSEWERLERAFAALDQEPNLQRCLISATRATTRTLPPLRLESPECPVPVKKQRKYNLSRWAVTGRDDIALNAACERRYRDLSARGGTEEDWKELCFLWSSDFRTHITDTRWTALKARLTALETRLAVRAPPPVIPDGTPISNRFIDIATPCLRTRLDRRRGLALEDVSFAGSEPLIGKLPLGVYDDIALQADWYSGDTVFEAPGEHKVTDLEWSDTTLAQDGPDIVVCGRIATPKGPIVKTLRFGGREPTIDFDISFDWPDWGKGSLRLGILTLLPPAWGDLTLKTHNGGRTIETFALTGHDIEHGAPVSFLVSASQGLGMTEGWAELGDGRHILRIEVDRRTAPLMGLVTHRLAHGRRFCQFALSALELDDTRKPDALQDGPRRFRFRLMDGKSSATY